MAEGLFFSCLNWMSFRNCKAEERQASPVLDNPCYAMAYDFQRCEASGQV